MKYVLSIIIIFAFFTSCRLEQQKPGERLNIVCTTGMIGDAVENIVGDDADVYTIMGPGTDPHLYKPTPDIIQKLEEADVIIHNGLHLEGKMSAIFEKLKKEKKVLTMSDGIDPSELLASYDGSTVHDPHIWFDLQIWSEATAHIGKKLIEIDTSKKEVWSKNVEKYTNEIQKLDEWVKNEIQQIPEQQRVIITSHDAFRYFGKRYSMEVKGLQGISTVSEFGLKDISEMVNFIVGNQIKAVFVESSVSDKSMKAVMEGCQAHGHDLKIGGTLYSDAMGPKDEPSGNYIGMIRHNVQEIVNALQ